MCVCVCVCVCSHTKPPVDGGRDIHTHTYTCMHTYIHMYTHEFQDDSHMVNMRKTGYIDRCALVYSHELLEHHVTFEHFGYAVLTLFR
jgi:hypothetical protein